MICVSPMFDAAKLNRMEISRSRSYEMRPFKSLLKNSAALDVIPQHVVRHASPMMTASSRLPDAPKKIPTAPARICPPALHELLRQTIPLYGIMMGWVCPAAVGALIGLCVSLFQTAPVPKEADT